MPLLYAPDYVPATARLDRSARVYRDLSRYLPHYEIAVGYAMGSFQDDDGTGSQFDRASFGIKKSSDRVLSIRRDFFTSLVSLARQRKIHKPRIVIGDGQGGLIALGYARPAVLEQALAARDPKKR